MVSPLEALRINSNNAPLEDLNAARTYNFTEAQLFNITSEAGMIQAANPSMSVGTAVLTAKLRTLARQDALPSQQKTDEK
jgi:hypothetical protein